MYVNDDDRIDEGRMPVGLVSMSVAFVTLKGRDDTPSEDCAQIATVALTCPKMAFNHQSAQTRSSLLRRR
eukprot:scaffold682669_cov64-Prasinocladus_malaysianus.AAC.1